MVHVADITTLQNIYTQGFLATVIPHLEKNHVICLTNVIHDRNNSRKFA